jgi:hypothetical protein
MYDNFHYMDEDNVYDHGAFATYDEALAAAKRLVEEEIAHYKFDMGLYCGFADEPGILGPPGMAIERFSARDYARQLCEAHEAARASSLNDEGAQ